MSPPDDYRYTYFELALVSIPHKLGHQYDLLHIIFEYYLQFYPYNLYDELPSRVIPVFWNGFPSVTREIVSNGAMGHETEPFSHSGTLWTKSKVSKKQLSENFYLPFTNLMNNLITIKIEIQLPRGLEFLQHKCMSFTCGRLFFETCNPNEVRFYSDVITKKSGGRLIWCKVDSYRQVSNKRHVVDANEIQDKETKHNVKPKSLLSTTNITYEIKGVPEFLLLLDNNWSKDMKQGFTSQNNNTIQCEESGDLEWGRERDQNNRNGDPVIYRIHSNETFLNVHSNVCNG